MNKVSEHIWGTLGTRFIGNIDSLLQQLSKGPYSFISNETYRDILIKDTSEGMRLYWTETLFRAHIAAATSIARSRRWIEGAVTAATAPNFLLFVAAIRGLLESSADTTWALGPVPETLAQRYQVIENALTKRLRGQIVISTELENTLIHYSHARKVEKREQVPNSHHARPVTEYLSLLHKGGVQRVGEMYNFLCDATHPGATSVAYLNEFNTPSDFKLQLSTQADRRMIEWFAGEYQSSMTDVLCFAFNPGIVTLRVLNFFSLPVVHTPTLSEWDLEDIALWTKCKVHLRNQGVQA